MPKIALYKCRKCGNKYTRANYARECEAGSTEERLERGTPVRGSRIEHDCEVMGKISARFDGWIVRVEGPFPFDDASEDMIMGDRKIWPSPPPGHVYIYLCAFSCISCKKEVLSMCYSAQLTPLEAPLPTAKK